MLTQVMYLFISQRILFCLWAFLWFDCGKSGTWFQDSSSCALGPGVAFAFPLTKWWWNIPVCLSEGASSKPGAGWCQVSLTLNSLPSRWSVSPSWDLVSPSLQPPANTATPTTCVSTWTSILWTFLNLETSNSAIPLSGHSLRAPCFPSLPLNPAVALIVSAAFRLTASIPSPGLMVCKFYCAFPIVVSHSPFQTPPLGDPHHLHSFSEVPKPSVLVLMSILALQFGTGPHGFFSSRCTVALPMEPVPNFSCLFKTYHDSRFLWRNIYSSCFLKISRDPDMTPPPLSFSLEFCALPPPTRSLRPTSESGL